jgi:hypothetical protein
VDVVPAYRFEDAPRDPTDAWHPHLLRVPDPYLLQLFRRLCVCYPDPGYYKGTEVITLPGLVDAEPRRTVEDGSLSRAGSRSLGTAGLCLRRAPIFEILPV